MKNRIEKTTGVGKSMIIDGFLKDNDSFSEFSRKGAKNGSKDISLMYAYAPETKEPIAVKPYPGNMLDLRAV